MDINLSLWIFYSMICLGVSSFGAWLVVRAGLMDTPVHRSSHQRATPTAGGLALGVGVGTGLIFLFFSVPLEGEQRFFLGRVLLLGGLALLIGFCDDLLALTARQKFLALLFLSFCAAGFTGPVLFLPLTEQVSLSLPYWLAFLGTGLWFFGVLNIINFMDGANGLMLSVMMVAFLLLAFIGFSGRSPEISLLSMGMVFSIPALLFFNFRKKAKLFSGDSGALFVGMLFAFLTLTLAKQAIDRESINKGLVYGIPLLIAPFLADSLLTLGWRLWQRRPVSQGHREHFYQLALRHGWPHLRVAVLYAFVTLILGGLAVWVSFIGVVSSLVFLLALSVIFTLIAYRVRKWAIQAGYGAPY